jgi:mRNA interferase MazF
MVITQGDVCWADLPAPEGSGPGFRRPVAIVQSDPFNRSRLSTALCVPLTSNLLRAEAPGNVLLSSKETGLPKDSVANVSQLVSIDKQLLSGRTGRLTREKLASIFSGIDLLLGR